MLAYLEHVADRFDLRRDIQLGARVSEARFDEQTRRWSVTVGDRVFSARYLISAVGCLSTPNTPTLPGLERFAGRVLHTGSWPREGVDLSGRSVAVIGTGSSAIQLIPEVARACGRLTVFQRTANFVLPALNAELPAERHTELLASADRLRQEARASFYGTALWPPFETRTEAEIPPDEQQRILEARWKIGGFALGGTFADVVLNPVANERIAEFARARIREKVRDPAVAEKLVPRGYPYACKRLCLDSGYYETFNRDNVTLVDVKETPIVEVLPHGIRTEGGAFAADVLVFATGFDAMTGALDRIDIRGRGDRSLRELWAAGPKSYLGLAVHGFPNLFTVTGPLSPSVQSNMVVSIEQHVEWIAEAIAHLEREQLSLIEAGAEAEAAWTDHVATVGSYTLLTSPSCSSWYLGSNIPGKPRVFAPYLAGVGVYGAKLGEVAQKGYEGFVLSR